MNTPRDDEAWHEAPARAGQDEMLAPRTQLVPDRDAYLGQGRHDVGRRISAQQVELFIGADVAGSLQREFMQHQSEFIVVHDVGISASLRLLGSLASAAGGAVQRLAIRRQGHGVALAVLQFVEVPMADGNVVRVYASDFSADTQTRAQVARVLLGFSRLGVLLVGELPPHALTGQLFPLQEAIQRGPWPNRDLLMVPLGSGAALAAQAAQFAGQSAVAVHVTPHASKPRQAWNYIGGAWNRLHGGARGERTLPTELERALPPQRLPDSEAPTRRMGLDAPVAQAMPQRHAAPPLAASAAAALQAYAERCGTIKGAVACCVFDVDSMQPLAQWGTAPAGETLAEQGARMLAQCQTAAHALGLAGMPTEATVTVAGHHLMLRPVPGRAAAAVHLVLQAGGSNLTLARMQLDRIELPR